MRPSVWLARTERPPIETNLARVDERTARAYGSARPSASSRRLELDSSASVKGRGLARVQNWNRDWDCSGALLGSVTPDGLWRSLPGSRLIGPVPNSTRSLTRCSLFC